MNSEVFVKASRNRYRFDTGKVSVSTEDLWQLTLVDLNRMAVALHKSMSTENITFLENPQDTPVNIEVKDKLEIIKHIIETKQSENKAKLEKQAIATKKARIAELLEKKQDESLSALSTEELTKLLNELG